MSTCMHCWGYPTRLDLLRSTSIAYSVVKDRQLRNLNTAGFFIRMLDPMTTVQRRDRAGNLIGPNLDLVGKNWCKRFISRHPGL